MVVIESNLCFCYITLIVGRGWIGVRIDRNSETTTNLTKRSWERGDEGLDEANESVELKKRDSMRKKVKGRLFSNWMQVVTSTPP